MAQTIIVDISTRGANPVAYTHQGDTGRTFFAEIYENGEAFAVAGYTIKVGAILPADRGYYVIAGNDMVTATKTNDNTTNKIYFTLSDKYSLKAGNGILTLIFTSNTGTPSTIRPINIDLRIQKSADGDDVIMGASDWPVGIYDYINDWLEENDPAEIANIKSEMGERSYNMVDPLTFRKVSSLTVENGIITGTAAQLYTAFYSTSIIPPAQFKTNTRYTLSFDSYTDQNASSSGYGLRVDIHYVGDTSYNAVATMNTESGWTHHVVTSAASKTISKINIVYLSGDANIWHIKNLQVTETTSEVEFRPYLTARDDVARTVIEASKIEPQWVRGYWGTSGGRPTPNTDQMNRFITTYKLMYLYKGSFIYTDTPNIYRFTVARFADEDGSNMVYNYSGYVPNKDNIYRIPQSGLYCVTIQRIDNGVVNVADVNEHVKTGLYSNKPNDIYHIFIGGGKANFYTPGDATLIIGNTGKVIMVDSGMKNTEGNLLSEMAKNGIQKPDYIIISHMHDDHIGGLWGLLNSNVLNLNDTTIFLPSQAGIDYAIEEGLLTGNSLSYYNALMDYIDSATNCTVIRPSTEWARYEIDGMSIKFWNVNHQPYITLEDTNYNDYSLCCNIEYGTQRVCYTGDIGHVAMGLNAGKNYKCNVYKAQHHGWDNITADADILEMKKWLSTVFPQVAISEDGISHDTLLQGNAAPMPDWCEDNGVPFYRTNQNGAIYVKVSPNNFEIMTPTIRWTKSENQ